jgi:hypothetical protein
LLQTAEDKALVKDWQAKSNGLAVDSVVCGALVYCNLIG